ncbi:MAG: DNA translocase FtsK 4TM domain-containing protein [Actinomycetota bacterium]|nr:DNA translocase FtsK 4TM domain-containing protein [Actinomycetota bacterium]
MATWGQPSRRSKKAAPARPAARNDTAATNELPRSRRDQASAELREAVGGRENEFWGIGLVGLGLLLGLGIYMGDQAGPVGRGVATVVGWFSGVGRFIVPIAMIGAGVALVRKGRSDRRWRLTVGWALAAASVMGVLHVARQPDGLDEMGDAGGWIGALFGAPLRGLLATAGAIVVLVVLFLGGLMLITGNSVRTMAGSTGKGMGSVFRPMGRKLRHTMDSMATLKSEREGGQGQPGTFAGELPSPVLYDGEADNDWDPPTTDPLLTAAATKRTRTPKGPPVDTGPGEQSELELGPGAQRGAWTLPPMTYLQRSTNQVINKAEVEARGRTLVDSLASHGVETRLVGQTVGPTVTRYELELGQGVKVARITSLTRDIAYAMAAIDVRILAPIPGRSAIGVEVPNHTRQLVSLGDIMNAPESKTANHPLDVAVGKDIAGRAVFLNLSTMPHLLIAGTTGSGKSSGLNCIITSILMRTTPDQVRLILIDPKQVEMGQYNRAPHLLTQPVTNPKKAANALGWACKEMDRRYDLLFEVGFRDITGYNAAYDRGELTPEPGSAPDTTTIHDRLPYIVVVVDELNDLMMVAARDVEESITRIAQKARAVGIHLIVATQRPSVNVITGVIKANIPARIAYAVNSLTDSRVILDQPGAEKLVGKGDMLLLPGNSNVSQRIQGSFVSEEEVRKVVAHWRRQAPEPVYATGVEGDEGSDGMLGGGDFGGNGEDSDEDETLMRQAMELVVRSQLGSTSMLQRKLKVGFARAGRIMDLLEQRGVVGPSEGSKARSVMMTVEEYELIQQAHRNR